MVKTFVCMDIFPKKKFVHEEDLMAEGKQDIMAGIEAAKHSKGWMARSVEQVGKAAGPSNNK